MPGSKALACFHALETLRLDARIKTDLPGVYRSIERLRTATVDQPGCSLAAGRGTVAQCGCERGRQLCRAGRSD